jgi:hypothetical protein
MILATMISTTLLTGCSIPNINIPFLSKEEEVEESTEEESTEEEDAGFSLMTTADVLGYNSSSLLTQLTSYPQLTITYYSAWHEPLAVESYVVDSTDRTAAKYWYNQSGIGMTYYDNYSNKAWQNDGMTSWQQVQNQRLESLEVYLNADKFTETQYDYDDMYAYVYGNLDVYTDSTVLMSSLYKMYPNMTDISIVATYDRETKALFHMELTVASGGTNYLVGVTPNTETKLVTIPDRVINGIAETEEEVSKLDRIPMDTWLWSALYLTESNEGIDREYIINSYGFIASDIEREYGEVDIDTFIEKMVDMGNTMSVQEFLNSYDEKAGEYDDTNEKAAYEYLYEKLNEMDDDIEDSALDKLIAKPEEEESESEDGEGGDGEESENSEETAEESEPETT